MIKTSEGYKAITIHDRALEAYEEMNRDLIRKGKSLEMGQLISSLHSFIYNYTCIVDSTIKTDDEIINWTFVDVISDLSAANWNISCGFYKIAASALRNALEMSAVSLYFQISENEYSGRGYNFAFREWDRGNADTPNWGTMKGKINKSTSVKKFNNTYGYNIVDDLYKHFKELCNFTHSRPFASINKSACNNMNISCGTPDFSEVEFDRFMGLMDITIGWIATIWLVVFPQMLKAEYISDNSSNDFVKLLLKNSQGKDAFEFAKKV